MQDFTTYPYYTPRHKKDDAIFLFFLSPFKKISCSFNHKAITILQKIVMVFLSIYHYFA